MVAFCVAMLFFGEGFENAVYKICTKFVQFVQVPLPLRSAFSIGHIKKILHQHSTITLILYIDISLHIVHCTEHPKEDLNKQFALPPGETVNHEYPCLFHIQVPPPGSLMGMGVGVECWFHIFLEYSSFLARLGCNVMQGSPEF